MTLYLAVHMSVTTCPAPTLRHGQFVPTCKPTGAIEDTRPRKGAVLSPGPCQRREGSVTSSLMVTTPTICHLTTGTSTKRQQTGNCHLSQCSSSAHSPLFTPHATTMVCQNLDLKLTLVPQAGGLPLQLHPEISTKLCIL